MACLFLISFCELDYTLSKILATNAGEKAKEKAEPGTRIASRPRPTEEK